MEIERKFIPLTPPAPLEEYPYHEIEQAYLCTAPVVRVRKEDDHCYMTVKGPGGMSHEEFELPLSMSAYLHLLEKCDGILLRKRRYLIPYGSLTIELDVFKDPYEGLRIAEVEFPSVEEALAFVKPSWFGAEVTDDPHYRNAYLASGKGL